MYVILKMLPTVFQMSSVKKKKLQSIPWNPDWSIRIPNSGCPGSVLGPLTLTSPQLSARSTNFIHLKFPPVIEDWFSFPIARKSHPSIHSYYRSPHIYKQSQVVIFSDPIICKMALLPLFHHVERFRVPAPSHRHKPLWYCHDVFPDSKISESCEAAHFFVGFHKREISCAGHHMSCPCVYFS